MGVWLLNQLVMVGAVAAALVAALAAVLAAAMAMLFFFDGATEGERVGRFGNFGLHWLKLSSALEAFRFPGWAVECEMSHEK